MIAGIKKPNCANSPVSKVLTGDMNDLQFSRLVQSERKICNVITSMRTENKFKRYIGKLLKGNQHGF